MNEMREIDEQLLDASEMREIDEELLNAAEEGNVEGVRSLLGAGADPKAKDDAKLKVSRRMNMRQMTRHDMTSLRRLMHFFFDVGREKSSPYTKENLPLHHAVIYLAADELARIPISGAMIDQQDDRGHTALHVAARIHRPEHAQILLARHANPDSINKQGDTPAHLAVTDSLGTDVLRLLVATHANVNAQNWWGVTPLHRAVEVKNIAAIRVLRKAGAILEIEDDMGHTPMDLAEGKVELIDALICDRRIKT